MNPISPAITHLLELGVLGPITVILGFYCWKLHNKFLETEDKRVTDAQAVTDKLINLHKEWSSTIREHSHYLDALNSSMHSIADNVMDIRDEVLHKEFKNRGK